MSLNASICALAHIYASSRPLQEVLFERHNDMMPPGQSGITATPDTLSKLVARHFPFPTIRPQRIQPLRTRVACARARNVQGCHRIGSGDAKAGSGDREPLVGFRTESLLPSPYLIDVICALPLCMNGGQRHHRGPRRVGARERESGNVQQKAHSRAAAGHDRFRDAREDHANGCG
ncbi:hypothetical protein Bphy_1692 [Paraburkholderia phymatum STM815]|uniref:Uncharacterized protein n=1 Tax=Paraburkholderia phymatum (strain DSM 17167 / CIP 108236 / LMG 21445 / STM815) TaxID=391038 RepID=B2JKP7_PARP8|nr:hypothetical protein Bphy_1692 [Paraburkholderia phymatum STM815]